MLVIRHARLLCAAAALGLFPGAISAGEIAGAPVPLPLSIDADLYIHWGNDAFGKGGSEDDYRTQQSILNARLGDRWLLALDYSILTVGAVAGSAEPVNGRLDELSASLGYIIHQRDGGRRERLSAGLGARATGDFAGEEIQNGFHKLNSGRVVQLDYVSSDDVVAIGWVQGSLQETLFETSYGGFGKWDLGYWANGTLLGSSDGQVDGSAALYGIVENGSVRLWVGARGDLREGYSQDPVQSATARVEEGVFYVVGLSIGPLILQTVQAISADTQSFGNLSLTANESEGQPIVNDRSALGAQVSLLLPDIQVETQLRYSPASINEQLPPGRRINLIAGFRYGEPPYEGSTTAFVETRQVGFQIELEGETRTLGPWIKPYASFGLGWRSEQLLDDASGERSKSQTVERGVALGEIGLRFDSAGRRSNWNLQIQLGLGGWLPFSDEVVVVDGTRFTLQEPDVALSAGIATSVSW